jgi:hypothetical protein
MRLRNRLDRLEHLAPQYFEVWEQDGNNPRLYRYEGSTLTTEALNERARTTPGLQVVRIVREHVPVPG